MKKIISVILVALMALLPMSVSASAGDYEQLPIIYIRGNGEEILYPDGTKVTARLEDLSLDSIEGGVNKDIIVETAVNILKPFVLEGMLFDKWDSYGQALYDEIAPLFKDAGLDENGNAMNGTGIAQSLLDAAERDSNSADCYNRNTEYNFRFDWRLSPYDHVDRLHTFIQNIMAATGKKQVSLYARCLGGGLLMAYLDKYGHEGHIKNVIFSDVLSNESTIVSKAFSGQVEFDAKTIEKYLGQLDFCGRVGQGTGFVFSDILNEIVFKTMDFFNQVNITDKALDGVEVLYNKLYKALIPAICHAIGMATQVNYWTCVAEEDMDKALDLIFGEEGTETRIRYAGLIEKIELYRANVSSDLDGFYDSLEENNIHYGFIAKYGFLNPPFTKDADLISDSLVSLTHATYGATTAHVAETLSDEYIAMRVAEGNGKYISPDKQVDLTTGRSPETTWVIKNAHHNVMNAYIPLVKSFLNGTGETVDSLTNGNNYMIFSYDTVSYTVMTEENCADYEFMTISTESPTTETRIVAFMRFLTMIINLITKLFNGTLDFSNLLG